MTPPVLTALTANGLDAASLPPANAFGALSFLMSILAVMMGLPILAIQGYLSAPFGNSSCRRAWVMVHATIMLGLLCGECIAFQVWCSPSFRWVLLFDGLALLTAWSFLRAAFTNPGTSSSPEWSAWHVSDDVATAKKAALPVAEESGRMEQCFLGGRPWCGRSGGGGEEQPLRQRSGWSPGEVSMCAPCGQLRPERAHHCRHCGVCVLRLDHHCSLLGNCVGWRNHKYFILLLWWQFWTCLVFLIAPDGPVTTAGVISLNPDTLWQALALQLSVAWAGLLLIISGKSFVDSVFNAARNETCVEANYKGDNPYARGVSCFRNLQQVVGNFDLRLFLPLEPGDRLCNGTCFEIVQPQGQEKT